MNPIDALFPGMSPTRPLVMAGPCSAESERQVMDTALGLRAAGVRVFRAGLWKPRTRPDAFEGVGERGLAWLQQVKQQTGMKVGTEVASPRHVQLAREAGLDFVWLGARTTVNPFLVQQLADELGEEPDEMAVLVKNPVSPDLELWVGALERLREAGIGRLAAVHRGFTATDTGPYRNAPQWHLPIELRRRLPSLALLCDPSHLGGDRALVACLAQQAMDLDFDGLMVEAHVCPDRALSDARQQLTPEALKTLVEGLVLRRGGTGDARLQACRAQIDECDDQLFEVLSRRLAVCREIGELKRSQGWQVLQSDRYSDMLARRTAQAGRLGLSAESIQRIMEAVHEESLRQQMEIMNQSSHTL